MIRLEMWGIACALVLAPWAANAQPADPFEARMAYALNQASVEAHYVQASGRANMNSDSTASSESDPASSIPDWVGPVVGAMVACMVAVCVVSLTVYVMRRRAKAHAAVSPEDGLQTNGTTGEKTEKEMQQLSDIIMGSLSDGDSPVKQASSPSAVNPAHVRMASASSSSPKDKRRERSKKMTVMPQVNAAGSNPMATAFTEVPITPASESGESTPSLAQPKKTAFAFDDSEPELFEPSERDAAEDQAVTRKASV